MYGPLSNTNRIIVAQLNINSLRNKVDALKAIISGKIDVLVITESKLDHTFHTNQFLIDGFPQLLGLAEFLGVGVS